MPKGELNEYTITFLLIAIAAFTLGIVGKLMNADYIYITLGAIFIGVSLAQGSNPAFGRPLKNLLEYIALTLIFLLLTATAYLSIEFIGEGIIGPVVLGIAAIESLTLALVIRFLTLFNMIKTYRRFVVDAIKELNSFKSEDSKCGNYVDYLLQMLLGLKESISLYLREEHEFSIIQTVKAIETFLRRMRNENLIHETGFVKAIREFLRSSLPKESALIDILKNEAPYVYSLRSKYAHENSVHEHENMYYPYKVREFLKHTERSLKRGLPVFEAVAAITYGCVFTYVAIKILSNSCPQLSRIIPK